MAAVVPDIPELFEEAFERIGRRMTTGSDLRSARRSLNLLFLEWANRGLNLFTIEGGVQTLTAGTATYTMPADTIDLIEHHLRIDSGTDQRDSMLIRISVSTYAQQYNKNMQGRPTQIFVQRLASSVTATLWPVPDDREAYSLFYYRLVGIDGLASGIGDTLSQIPPRFVPALVAGLAYQLGTKTPEAASMLPTLKTDYEAQFNLAAGEDRERASLYLVPGRMS